MACPATGGRGMTPPRTTFTQADGVTLKEYVDTRLAALEKATELAANALRERLATMNEFRDTLRDQAGQFVTRKELDLKLNGLAKETAELRQFRDRQEGMASQRSVNAATLIAVAGLILSIIGLAVRFLGV